MVSDCECKITNIFDGMKIFSRVLLILAAIGLGWAVFNSIQVPVNFKNARTEREKEVIKELVDIRTAQVAFKQENNKHAATFEELRNWLQNGNMKTIRREMELTEEQLERGITEEKAVAIVKKAQATGNWDEATKEGLVTTIDGIRKVFTRDTIYVNAKQAVFGNDYDVSKLGIIPYSDGATFQMDTASVMTGSGFNIKVFEANATFDQYLGDLNKNELNNIIDKAVQIGKFPGLKVGSLEEINNYAGNWE